MPRGIKNNEELNETIEEDVEDVKSPSIIIPSAKNTVYKNGIMVMSAEDYEEYSARKGGYMGRKKGNVIKPNLIELKVRIKAGWNDSKLLAFYGIDHDTLKAYKAKLFDEDKKFSQIMKG
jgi:hypothetical protein